MNNSKFLSSTSLKLIAISVMLIDHIAASAVFNITGDTYNLMRIIGRLAFPIFAFLISEGYFYTKNVYKYIFRLGLFAIISEFAFDLAFFGKVLEFSHQNIFFTLFMGLIALIIFDSISHIYKPLGFLLVILMSIIAELLYTDYGLYGVLYIFAFYIFRGNFAKTAISILSLNIVFLILDIRFFIQFLSIFALVIIFFYNNKKGRSIKYLFYAFYPLHLILLYLVKEFLKEG
jgi:hypothetical protein